MRYLKKSQKTAEGNADRVRSAVKEILSRIETDGEQAVVELARKFDNWEGDSDSLSDQANFMKLFK